MYYYYEDKEDCTVCYQVQTIKWSLCCAYFYLSEAFEFTFIPTLYRSFHHKARKPTFMEWLGKHPRWWSRTFTVSRGTRFHFDTFPELTVARLKKVEWNFMKTRR